MVAVPPCPMSTHGRDVDRVFEALSHERRRRLLVALDDRGSGADGSADLDALVATIAADEDPETVRVELLHCHLPKLERAGYVTWDGDGGTVGRGPEWDAVEPFLLVLRHGPPSTA